MPETKSQARAHAKRVGIPLRNVVKASSGGHFIAPRGVTSGKGKRAYAECRAGGGKQSTCAAVAHNIHARHSR
jgi:hypothetical protein